MFFKVKQGSHYFKPTVALNVDSHLTEIKWAISFTEDCIYNHNDVDQLDWNKLCGVSFDLFTNHKNSAMIGWRWNVNTQKMELTPYVHVDGTRWFWESGSVFTTVPINQRFFVTMKIDWENNTVAMEVTSAFKVYFKQQYTKLSKKYWFIKTKFTREIGAYFGGNKPAPHDMVLVKSIV